MNLEEVQTFVYNRLSSDTLLSGASIIQEDGSYPLTPGIEEALKTTGLVIVVFQVEGVSVRSVTPSGHSILTVECPIIVHENQKVCRTTGANIEAEKAIRLVQERIAGSGSLMNAQQRFRISRNGFEQFGKLNGLNCRYTGFEIDLTVVPRA